MRWLNPGLDPFASLFEAVAEFCRDLHGLLRGIGHLDGYGFDPVSAEGLRQSFRFEDQGGMGPLFATKTSALGAGCRSQGLVDLDRGLDGFGNLVIHPGCLQAQIGRCRVFVGGQRTLEVTHDQSFAPSPDYHPILIQPRNLKFAAGSRLVKAASATHYRIEMALVLRQHRHGQGTFSGRSGFDFQWAEKDVGAGCGA